MSLSELGHAVKRLQVKLYRAATDALAPLEVTLVQWDALRHLQNHPGASLHDLARLAFQTDQAFGTLAARLETRGLIRRVNSGGRAIRPELTTEGERVLAEGLEVTERVVRESFAPLDAHERAMLAGMLERLLADAARADVSLRPPSPISRAQRRPDPLLPRR
jgi:DNA-binding MarR family transcriptional regulator